VNVGWKQNTGNAAAIVNIITLTFIIAQQTDNCEIKSRHVFVQSRRDGFAYLLDLKDTFFQDGLNIQSVANCTRRKNNDLVNSPERSGGRN